MRSSRRRARRSTDGAAIGDPVLAPALRLEAEEGTGVDREHGATEGVHRWVDRVRLRRGGPAPGRSAARARATSTAGSSTAIVSPQTSAATG